jgi:hypothetical protein
VLTLLLLLQAATSDIVITGKRLEEAHALCVRGGCTPLRDAQASIALAESQFRDGVYLDAKRLLAAAISRNRGKAASDPKPVAALYEAFGTVALHEGDQNAYKTAVRHQVQTLRDNLPAGDPAVVSASTALGDMWIKDGNYHQAVSTFRGIERAALAAGEERSAVLAGMKLALLSAMTGQVSAANRKLDELEARPIAAQPGFATALNVVRLRVATRNGDEAEITRRIRELGGTGGAGPVLIWAPSYARDAIAEARALRQTYLDPVKNPDLRSTDFERVHWADVGFWIRPDGRTAEAEVLRGSRSTGWTSLYLDQLAKRRYSASTHPALAGELQQGVYRVERVTLRTRYETPPNSLIERRVAAGGFHVLDLTEDPKAAPPPADG